MTQRSSREKVNLNSVSFLLLFTLTVPVVRENEGTNTG